MNFEAIIEQYGYLAILIGAFLEGETILVLGGFVAHNGHLDIVNVMLAAGVGALLGDQLYFYIGRHKGMAMIESRPHWQARSERIFNYLHKHQNLFILSFRFMYGVRTIAPFVIGASGISPVRYTVLNLIGAVLWAVAIGSLGYFLGQFATQILEDVKKYELWILLTLVLLAIAYWFYRKYRVDV